MPPSELERGLRDVVEVGKMGAGLVQALLALGTLLDVVGEVLE